MKKPYNIAVTALMLVIALFFGVRYRVWFLGLLRTLSGDREMLKFYIEFMPDVLQAFAVMVLSLVIFVVRVILTVREGQEKPVSKSSLAEFGGKLGELLENQRIWILEWRERRTGRNALWIYGLSAVAVALVMYRGYSQGAVGVGYWGYLAEGLCWGEPIALITWFFMSWNNRTDKILKGLGKSIRKQFGDTGESEIFAGDLLEAESQWAFREESNKDLNWGIMGSRYWAHFDGYGRAVVVEPNKLVKIASEMYTTRHRNVTTYHYVVNFYYENAKHPNRHDKQFSFEGEDGSSNFVKLARERVGERVQIEG